MLVLRFLYSPPPSEAIFFSPPGFENVDIPAANPETIDYAKKLIDDLHASKVVAKSRNPLPPVPDFSTSKQCSKLSPHELFGPSDSESVSEAHWTVLNAETSDSSENVQNEAGENYYDECSGSEGGSSTAEESGSDYESGSSFEEAKRKQSQRKTRGSATCKQSAAARKKQFHITKARSVAASPQSVYTKQKGKTVAGKKKTGPQKRKAQATPSASDSNSATPASESSDNSVPPSKNKPPQKRAARASPSSKLAEKEMKDAGKKAAKGTKLPAKAVEMEFTGSQKKGVPVVDSRPGKKQTRAGRKRNEERRGRKPKSVNTDLQKEIDNVNDRVPEHARILPSAEQLAGKRAVEKDGITEDPMLEEEILRPLVVNELADHGTFVVNELEQDIKIWDAEVSCKGGYHWILGDINSTTYPDPPMCPTFIPLGEPGPNIPGLAKMHAALVLESFLPLISNSFLVQVCTGDTCIL